MNQKRRTALRSTKNGQLFPMNPDMSRSDDTELVYLDEKGNVVEPEEYGPADLMDLPALKESEKGSQLPPDYYTGGDTGNGENPDPEDKSVEEGEDKSGEEAEDKSDDNVSTTKSTKPASRTTRRRG